MRAKVKGIAGDSTLAPALADAFAMIERHDKKVTLILGPENLLGRIRLMTGTFNTRDDTLWTAKLKADESLDYLYVTDKG